MGPEEPLEKPADRLLQGAGRRWGRRAAGVEIGKPADRRRRGVGQMQGERPVERPQLWPDVRRRRNAPGGPRTTAARQPTGARNCGLRLPALRPRWIEGPGVGRRHRGCPLRRADLTPRLPTVAVPVRKALPGPGSRRRRSRNDLPLRPLFRSYCRSLSPPP